MPFVLPSFVRDRRHFFLRLEPTSRPRIVSASLGLINLSRSIHSISFPPIKMSDDDEQQARHAALVEFVGIFEDVSSAPTNLSDLSDGVALFEALSEM